MNIGINTLFLIPGKVGGSEVYIRNLLDNLAKIDKKNTYILFTNKENSGTFTVAKNFKEVICPIKAEFRPLRILWEQLVLPAQAKRHKIDILFSPGYTTPLLKTCPSVVTTHDMQYKYFPEDFSALGLLFVRLLIPASVKKSDMVITISQSSKRDIVKFCNVSENKVRVIYEGKGTGFDKRADRKQLDAVREKFGIKKDYILTVANSYPHKNIPRLLEAFHILSISHTVDLVIIGIKGRGHKSVEKNINTIRDRVILTGRVSKMDLGLLYAGAKVFVFPSLHEGFGLPVLEAMSQGIPVVSSNAASLPEIVGNAGILFDGYNSEEMANKIKLLLDDEKQRKKMIAMGMEQSEKFNWQKTAIETLEVFKTVSLQSKK